MIFPVVLLLSAHALLANAGLTPSPESDPLCPSTEPARFESCSGFPSLADCLYEEFSFPGSEDVVYYQRRCTCYMGIGFLCLDYTLSSGVSAAPLADPINALSCPEMEPVLGDTCTTPSDGGSCQYRRDGQVSQCSCLDGSFACAIPTPLLSAAAKSNSDECPSDAPDMGDACSLPGATECLYKPFTCLGSFDVNYLRKCNCRGDSFVCSEQMEDCIPQCPFGTPPGPGDDCFLGQQCRYDPVGGTCRPNIQFQTNCQCKDQLDGTLAHDCDFTPIGACPPDPICPVEIPFGFPACSIDGLTCKYDPFGCPGSSDGGTYLTECTCDGNEFICSQALPFCFQDKPVLTVPCFAGDALVQEKDKGSIYMKDLRIGDEVNVGKNQYEQVYSFGHYNQEASASFFKLHTTSASTPLLISNDHMVYVQSRGFVPASSLRRGDKLVDGNTGMDATIQSIVVVKAQGVFAPFTPSGQIVVNNVLASSYVSLDSKPNLTILGRSIPHQFLAHSFEFPHRLVCHYLTKCPTESYTAEGISTWVATPFQVGQWMLAQKGLLRGALLSVVLVIAVLFAFLQSCVSMPVAPILLAMGIVVAMRRWKNEKKIV